MSSNVAPSENAESNSLSLDMDRLVSALSWMGGQIPPNDGKLNEYELMNCLISAVLEAKAARMDEVVPNARTKPAMVLMDDSQSDRNVSEILKTVEAAGADCTALFSAVEMRKVLRHQQIASEALYKVQAEYDKKCEELKAAKGFDLDEVHGDILPKVGSDVFIHLARADQWVRHTVAGYYVYRSHKENSGHRVFVRVVDDRGYDNSRLLDDIRYTDSI